MPTKTFSDPAIAQAGRDNLRDVAGALEKMGVMWWIEAGTFLGCIRENGRFIQHDSDIDIGVMGDAAADELTYKLTEIGFRVEHVFGRKGRGMEIAYTRRGVKVDVFYFYREGDKAWMAAWKNYYVGKVGESRMIRLDFDADLMCFPIQKIMEGVYVNCPNEPERYLIARYGKDWRKPDPDWRWDLDPKCINWEKSEWTRSQVENGHVMDEVEDVTERKTIEAVDLHIVVNYQCCGTGPVEVFPGDRVRRHPAENCWQKHA
jgi:hypothetical protein